MKARRTRTAEEMKLLEDAVRNKISKTETLTVIPEREIIVAIGEHIVKCYAYSRYKAAKCKNAAGISEISDIPRIHCCKGCTAQGKDGKTITLPAIYSTWMTRTEWEKLEW